MKSYFTKLIAPMLLAASLTGPAMAAQIYQVEMIIFSHLTPAGVAQEQWPTTAPPASDFSTALSLNAESASEYYRALSPNDFILKREQTEFNRNPEYQTLVHTAWLQPTVGARTAPIHIFGGHSYDIAGQTQWAVNGTVRVTVDHYLNVAFNLFFAVPDSTLARLDHNQSFHNNNQMAYFHLTEKRRMKSHELNYIDYPLFGVLIKIVPVVAAK